MTKNQVYWYTLSDGRENIEELKDNISCDVVIVGGGMAGLMCAQKLADSGRKVILLEKDFVGGGASGKSSGFITPDSELELSDLHDNLGSSDAKILWEFAKGGVKAIEENIKEFNFQCDYQKQDSLFIAKSESGFEKVKHEHEIQQSLGYESKLYDQKSIENVVGSRGYYGGIQYGETFGITSYLYCQQLKDVLKNKGVRIFENCEVVKIQESGVKTKDHEVLAQSIVVATDRWAQDLVQEGREIYHAQTFLGITRPLPDDLINYMFPKSKMMVWDTELIYQYFRVIGDNRLLIGGSNILYTYEPHAAISTALIRRKLQKYLHLNFPKLINVELEYLWPGLIGVSKDFLPVAGQKDGSKNIYYVGGAAGLPWAAALGLYLGEKILSGETKMDKFFDAKRKFVLGQKFQGLMGKPITFALAHGYEKFAP